MTVTSIDDARDGGAANRVELVRYIIAARFLEGLLAGLSKSGHIGLFRPAGRSVPAMVACGQALQPDDMLFGTPRDLPAALARRIRYQRILEQCFANAAAPELGRTLPGALSDAAAGIALSGGQPAAHLVQAAGWGFAARLDAAPRVAVALFGSGAFAHGDVHAAFKSAPVRGAHTVFVARGARAGELGLRDAAKAWGIRAVVVDGDNGGAVFQAVSEARERAISGEGPTLVDARHGDGGAEPIDARALQRAGLLSPELERSWQEEMRAALWRAREAAEAAGRPALDTLLSQLYAEPPGPS